MLISVNFQGKGLRQRREREVCLCDADAFLWPLRLWHFISIEISLSVMWVKALSVFWSQCNREIQSFFNYTHSYIHTYTHLHQVSEYVETLIKVWENKKVFTACENLKLNIWHFCSKVFSLWSAMCLCHLSLLGSFPSLRSHPNSSEESVPH